MKQIKDREKEVYKVTLWGSLVNVVLVVFKFVAGIVGHSSAMIADAVALFAVAVGIFIDGAKKIMVWAKGGELPQPGWLALAAALVSIVLKELTFQYTKRKAEQLDSQAMKANAWHHRSDALSSIGTAIGIGGAILLGERWTVLDPIASIAVGALIVKVAVDLLKNGMDELMCLASRNPMTSAPDVSVTTMPSRCISLWMATSRSRKPMTRPPRWNACSRNAMARRRTSPSMWSRKKNENLLYFICTLLILQLCPL